LAKERLAEFYLAQQRHDEAMPIFEEFTGYEDLEVRLQVTGWAGIAIVLDALRAEEFSGTDFQRETELREAIGRVVVQDGWEEMLTEPNRERFETIVERKNAFELPPQ